MMAQEFTAMIRVVQQKFHWFLPTTILSMLMMAKLIPNEILGSSLSGALPATTPTG
jgi:hypothetical protein